MFTKELERVGEADADGISVEIFRSPEGVYTTWWKVGISVFEVTQGRLSGLLDLAEGAIGFIKEEESDAA